VDAHHCGEDTQTVIQRVTKKLSNSLLKDRTLNKERSAILGIGLGAVGLCMLEMSGSVVVALGTGFWSGLIGVIYIAAAVGGVLWSLWAFILYLKEGP